MARILLLAALCAPHAASATEFGPEFHECVNFRLQGASASPEAKGRIFRECDKVTPTSRYIPTD